MKLSVLFVDDDENIIGGIRRMMYPMRKEWDLLYANGGSEALELLKEKPVDVIISDIRMPGIDGTQLLTKVKELYPQTVRITLSGYANDSLALRNTRIVHQSLSKPSTPENVKNTIERAFKLRKILHNDDLLELVNGINQLPSLPEIYLELEKEINSPQISIDKISEIISNDPIITAKILQITNSAFFGLPTQITNIKQALNYLGIKIIQNLVLSIKLFSSVNPSNPSAALYQSIFNHSNKVALLAQHLCKLNNSQKEMKEESFLSGLLHDIGKLVILEGIEGVNLRTDSDLLEYEQESLKSTHAEIGAYLLGIWGLPDSIVEAVAYHHDNTCQNYDHINTSAFVFIANNIINHGGITMDEIDENNLEEIINKFGKSYTEEIEQWHPKYY